MNKLKTGISIHGSPIRKYALFETLWMFGKVVLALTSRTQVLTIQVY